MGLENNTAIPIIIEGQFQDFQRFSRSKLVLKAVESCFVALNYCGNGSKWKCVKGFGTNKLHMNKENVSSTFMKCLKWKDSWA